MKKRSFNYFALLAVIILGLLAGCAVPQPHFDKTGRKIIRVNTTHAKPPFETRLIHGEEYRVSRDPIGQFGGTLFGTLTGSGPKTFNPLASNDASSSAVAGLMFLGLTETDAYTGLQVPLLAKSVEILSDNQTYTITLRKGLKWSDGHALTADDVVFTWNQIILPGLGNPSNRDVVMMNNKLPTVVKKDNLTVIFHTPEPFAPFMQNLGNPILPKHIIESIIQDDPKKFDALWGPSADPNSFVVNGPFILEQYDSGQRIRFKRNPNYFVINTANKVLPYVDNYSIQIVQDSNADLFQFEQGKTDTLGVSPDQVYYVRHISTKSSDNDFTIYDLGPATSTNFLVFNLNPRKNKKNKQPYVNPIISNWFRNIAFRKAIDYTLDRETMVMNILRGVGQPLYTPEPIASIYINPEIAKGHEQNLQKAKALLKSSGFYWDNDGKLYDRDHHLVRFELNTNSGNELREKTGVKIKNDLEQLGIKVDFKVIDFNILVGKMDTCDWQSTIMGLSGGSPTEPNSGVNVWRSTAALHLFNQRKPENDMPGSDIIEPWEKQIDQLFTEGARHVKFEERKPYYYQYQKLISDNAVLLYLYTSNSIVAVKNHLQNINPTPIGGITHNLDSIWIKVN